MPSVRLYLIEILHQTTTVPTQKQDQHRCILSKFYIKPQPWLTPQTCIPSCILSKFYIKPQQRIRHCLGHSCCILSKFYIKPQHPCRCFRLLRRCILSKFYIKPQHFETNDPKGFVVSYRNSTSNHNLSFDQLVRPIVVSYRNSTSNHNLLVKRYAFQPLYLIEILHQTTTILGIGREAQQLYLIEILHQTTTTQRGS